MMDEPAPDVTRLLIDWRDGKRAALDELTPIVYQELRRIATAYMRKERPDHTLQPTALINEAYMRLVDQSVPQFNSRSHFFGVAAHIMRQVLVDFARTRGAAKRGDDKKVPFDEARAVSVEPSAELIDLHEALDRLAAHDERKAKVIELRYFGGLSREEVAEALGLTLATVKRDLTLAEAWLRRDMRASPA